MSADVEGEIKLLYNDDDVVTASKATAKTIGSLSKEVDKDLTAMGKSADDAADDFNALGGKAKTSMNQVANASDNAATSVKDTALEVVALGETFSGVAEAAFGFAEQLLSVERAMFGIEQTAVGLQFQIKDFQTAMDEGTLSIADQERGIREIQLAYKDMTQQQKEVDAQQQSLNGAFLSFGISLVQTVVITGIMLKQLGLTNVAMVKAKLTTLANGRALKLLRLNAPVKPIPSPPSPTISVAPATANAISPIVFVKVSVSSFTTIILSPVIFAIFPRLSVARPYSLTCCIASSGNSDFTVVSNNCNAGRNCFINVHNSASLP